MPVRDAAGQFQLNNPDDGTPIADQVDPERTNPALPHNVTQKIFDHGTSSEILCNTLLLAKVMFRKEMLTIDIDRAMQLALDAFSELVAMDDAAQAFTTAEQQAIDIAQRSPQQDRSLSIPSVGNVRTQCKTAMQKASHFGDALLNIVRLFYPDQRGMSWDDFHDLAKDRYGVDDPFYQMTAQAVPFLKLMRNARNGLEHPNIGVVTTDFELQANGTIAAPSIKIDVRDTSHDRCPISWFLVESRKALLNTFEMIVVHLCSKHVQPFAGMPIVVAPLPDNYRGAWHVRFAYGMYYADGQFAPIG
jgi:hypothetical protein